MTKVSGNQSSDVSAYIIYYKDHIISTCPTIPALTPATYVRSQLDIDYINMLAMIKTPHQL